MSFPDRSMPGPGDPLEALEQELMSDLNSDSPLTVALFERGGVPVVQVEGELDVYTADQLQQKIEEALLGAGSLVIDLGRTSFIDSKGLGVVMKAARRVPGRLAIVSTRERITRLFDLTGLSSALKVCRSLPEAVDSVKAV